MTTRSFKLAPGLTLPLDAPTQTYAIFGKRGSGKSNGATVLVEALLGAEIPVVVLDPVDAWWGLKSDFAGKGPGFPIYVFGGAHGDLPLESSAGALMADVVAQQRLSIVLSMKLWSGAERARFVTDFAKRLLQVNTEPLMVVCEEADAFIPQRPMKGEEAMLGAMDRLVRWGRQSGVGCTIVTQRSAKVNKDVTTQAETLIAFRTTGPQDRDAIDHWIKYHAGEEKREEVLSTLPTLETGTAWVWSPEWLGILKQVAFPRRSTFDSAATPKIGEKAITPKKLAAVDLERLRAQMAATVEKAKQDDPRELRRQIAELKKQVESKLNPSWIQPAPKGRETALLEQNRALRAELAQLKRAAKTTIEKRLFAFCERLEHAAHPLTLEREAWIKLVETLQRPLPAELGSPRYTPQAPPQKLLQPQERREPTGRAVPAVTAGRPARGNPDGALSTMHRRMLTALAQHPQGLTKKQVLVHTGYASSGPVSAAFADLAREGWAAPNGGRLHITNVGLQVLGPFDPLPLGDELREWLLTGDKLSTMERALLKQICAAYPEPIRKGDVLEQTGYASSGPVSAAFAKLVAYNYAVPQGPSMLRAAEELFS